MLSMNLSDQPEWFLMLLILAIELLLIFFFNLIGMYRHKSFRTNLMALMKGIFERSFVTIGLMVDLPVAIVFFGALKLGTRLDDENKNSVSNDQFLLGNMASVLAAIMYSLMLK
jgi:hypothetical protein